MDFSHYSDESVSLAVDLVNTRNPVSGKDALGDVAALEAFLARHWPDWQPEAAGAVVTDRDLAEVRALRERLRSALEAEDAATAAALINEILADVEATPRISLHGDAPHLHFEPRRARPAEWLGAVAAMGIGVVLCDHGMERFGSCSASDCDDVYVDTSRNRSRRHCSQSCTTRENVAAYRRRARAAGA